MLVIAKLGMQMRFVFVNYKRFEIQLFVNLSIENQWEARYFVVEDGLPLIEATVETHFCSALDALVEARSQAATFIHNLSGIE